MLAVVFFMSSTALAAGSLAVEGVDDHLESAIRGYVLPAIQSCSVDTENSADASKRIARLTREAMDATGNFAAHIAVTGVQRCQWRVQVSHTGLVQVQRWDLTYLNGAANLPESGSLFEVGELFVPENYEQRKRELIRRLNATGYLDAQFKSASVEVDPDASAASIDWQVDPGSLYRVRDLLIDQTTLSESLFRRFLAVQPGQPLLQKDLLQTYSNLSQSDYFSRIHVQPNMADRGAGEIDVIVEAEAAPRWSLLAGAGFATDSGPRLRTQADARYLNKLGHRLSASSLLAPVMSHAKAEYRWPYGDPTHQWYVFETKYSSEDSETLESDAFSLGIRRVARLGKRWTQTIYTDFLSERFDISTQDQRAHLLMVGQNLAYSTSIDTARPRKGTRLSIDIRGASEAVMSDTDLLQMYLQAKQILPFVAGSRWILRAEAGITLQSEVEELPASLRFFAGGDRSVRGFGLDTLGPRDELGEVVGGRRLLAGSVELDIPLGKQWSLALFSDIGSAYDTRPEFSQSVGVGLRWYSILGPIRVDLAHPLEDSSQALRLHISIGPDL